MQKTISLLFLLTMPLLAIAQQTIYTSLMHDGLEREYILYIPASYTGDDPVPIVFNFHGYTSNADEQMFYGDFRPIADTAGFIIVHPEGTLLNGSTHWNVGGWTNGSTVDDVGFTEAMIDAISAQYNINQERIYSTGMSNGGFMSFLLACQLSDRIAAIASVTGSMTPETFAECNPQHPMPVLQIHGTIDAVVPYIGALWTKPINDVLDYWVGFNHCDTDPAVTDVPNTNILDGSTVDHIIHENGDNGVTTEHFKVAGGGHTWPGAAFPLPSTNYDMDASLEIWKFFSRYDINGLIQSTSTDELSEIDWNIYPNPTNSFINVETGFTQQMEYEIVSVLGEVVLRGSIGAGAGQIDLSSFPSQVYFLKVGGRSFKVLKTN